ncbi:hypothetical protein BTR23_09860 [Alkalihalophilus pseudofirmus]|nr:hypothetical protein BTR23_09860 [Alkalihalophilus pseudofirmus]
MNKWKTLSATVLTASGFTDNVLKIGSCGEAVKTLQKGLNNMNYNVGVDGIFEPKTKVVMDKVLND